MMERYSMRANKEKGIIKCLECRKRGVVAYLDFSCATISVITVRGWRIKRTGQASVCSDERTDTNTNILATNQTVAISNI